MDPDKEARFEPDPTSERDFRERVQNRSWEREVKETVETPGRFAAIMGGLAGLIVAVAYGLMIGGTELQTVAALTALLVFVFLLVVAGEYWWALLVMATASGIRTSEFGFKMTGFEMGFVAILGATMIRMALRAMKQLRPPAGVGLPFFALSSFLLLHAVLVIVYSRYEDPTALKNIARGYFGILAPLVFFFLLGLYCHPKTVKPVTIVFLLITAATSAVAIPVWHYELNIGVSEDLPFTFSWLIALDAMGLLRSAPILAAFGLALYPSMRTAPRQFVAVGLFVLALIGAIASSGRLALAGVILVAVLFLGLNRKWGASAVGAVILGTLIFVATNSPELFDGLPKTVQRALAPMNLSQSDMKQDLLLSDRWHKELREDSFAYWTEDWATFLFGHGYKGWDQTISPETYGNADFEYMKKMAIQMGRTENAFSSITNIFGLTGLLLYVWFTLDLWKRLWRARKLSPPQSFEKAMCEVSLVYMAMFLILSPFAGGPPGWDLFYWQLGLLAARPLLAKEGESTKRGSLVRSRRAEEIDFGSRRRRPEKLAGSRSPKPALPGRARRLS